MAAYEQYLEKTPFLDERGEIRRPGLEHLTGSSEWDEDKFFKGVGTVNSVETASPGEYFKLVGFDGGLARVFSGEETEASRRAVLGTLKDHLYDFSVKRANELYSFVWEKSPQSLVGNYLFGRAFSNSFFRDLEDGSEFNGALDEIERNRKELERMGVFEKDKNKGREARISFLGSKLEGLDDLSRAFFRPFFGRIFSSYQSFYRNGIILAVGKYGFPKFFAKNLENADREYRDFEREVSGLPSDLSEEDRRKSVGEIAKKHPRAGVSRRLSDEIIGMAYGLRPKEEGEGD